MTCWRDHASLCFWDILKRVAQMLFPKWSIHIELSTSKIGLDT